MMLPNPCFDLIFSEKPVLRFQLQMADHAVQQQLQLIQAERLGHIIVRAILHRLNRRLHRAVARHNHDHRVRTQALDVVEGLDSARAGQAQIEQNRIDALRFQHPVSMFRRVSTESIESQGLGHFATGLPYGALIVNDKQVQKVCALDLSGGG
jgi:hypothetical protein